jgi:hypothetical protein
MNKKHKRGDPDPDEVIVIRLLAAWLAMSVAALTWLLISPFYPFG